MSHLGSILEWTMLTVIMVLVGLWLGFNLFIFMAMLSVYIIAWLKRDHKPPPPATPPKTPAVVPPEVAAILPTIKEAK
jgi:hypothetical protein